MFRISRLIAAFIVLCVIGGCAAEPIGMTLQPWTPAPTEEYQPPAATPAPAPEVAVRGGTLNISMRTPMTLNPIFNTDESVDAVLSLIFPKLMLLDEEHKPYVNSAIAQAIDFDHDAATVTVTLRDGARWHDGAPLSADDLIATLNAIRRAADNTIYKHTLDNVRSYERIDRRTVEMRLFAAYSGMDYNLVFPIIPAHRHGFYEGEIEPQELATEMLDPVGLGFFEFYSFSSARGMTLVASDSLVERPYIDRINVIITPDAGADLDALNGGLIDILDGGISDWARFSANPRFNVTERTTQFYDKLGFNFANPVLREKPVRQAILYSIPFDALENTIYGGAAWLSLLPINPQSWLARETEPPRFDLDAARRTLTEAGWGDDGGSALYKTLIQADLIRPEATEEPHEEYPDDYAPEPAPTPTPTPTVTQDSDPVEVLSRLSLTLIVNEENAERVALADLLAENLEEAGFDILVVSLPFAQFESRLLAREFDMFLAGYNLAAYPELSFMFGSRNALDGTNFSNYISEELDLRIRAVLRADFDGREEAVSALSDYLLEELPSVGIAFRKSAVVSNARLRANINTAPGMLFSNINEWHIIVNQR